MFLMMSLSFCCLEMNASGDRSYVDAFKDRCIELLPDSWQKKAEVWFWPTVGGVAVVAITAVCVCIKRTFFSNSVRQNFISIAHELLAADPLINSARLHDSQEVILNIFEDKSGGTLAFKLNKELLGVHVFKLPFVGIGPIIYDAIESINLGIDS